MTLLPAWMFSFYKAKFSTNQYCIVHGGVLWFKTLILYWFLKRQLFLAELFFPSWPFCQPYAHTEKAFVCNTLFLIGNQNSKEVSGHWYSLQTCVCRTLEKWFERYPQDADTSNLFQKGWALKKFCLFSTATAPSAWGVLLNTSFDWINIPSFTLSDLLFATTSHTTTTSTQDTQDGNCFPTPGLDRTSIQHQMGLMFQSDSARDRVQTWVVGLNTIFVASSQCLQCLTHTLGPIGDWFCSWASCRGLYVFRKHRRCGQKPWKVKKSSGPDQLNLS